VVEPATTPGPIAPEKELTVRNAFTYPTRIALGPRGSVYVSDARAGSVFILSRDLRVRGEIKNLRSPLGVAVAPDGRLYVGVKDLGAVVVYSASGQKLSTIDQGGIQMPNDLALDVLGNLYVADSAAHQVKIYDPSGARRTTIAGSGTEVGRFRFPSALAIRQGRRPGDLSGGELFVADQGNARIQVFDLKSRFLRSFGSAVAPFSADWKGRLVRVQSLAVDRRGRLHVLDSYLNRIQILDPRTGAYLGDYGAQGRAAAQLNLPLHLVLTAEGDALVANAENQRVERFAGIAIEMREGE
jgi:DNA-binding beta-propeller fold protein YncE